MSIKIGNQKYKFTPQREIEYKKFIDRIQKDGGELVNPSIGYNRYLKEGLSNGQVPIGRKEGKVYTIQGDYGVVRNQKGVEVNVNGDLRYVSENTPKIDYVNGYPELVVDGSCENIYRGSDLRNWIQARSSIIKSENNNFYVFSEDADDSGRPQIYVAVPYLPNQKYVISTYVRALEHDWIQLNPVAYEWNNNHWVNFNIRDGYIGNKGNSDVEAYITRVGNSDVFRCELVAEKIYGDVPVAVRLCVPTNNENSGRYPSYLSNYVDCFELAFPQLEVAVKKNGQHRASTPFFSENGDNIRVADQITNLEGDVLPIGRYSSI